MIPGEVLPADGEIEPTPGAATAALTVADTGDRPVQVGSHHHICERNPAIDVDPEICLIHADDDVRLSRRPAKVLPMAQRYLLF